MSTEKDIADFHDGINSMLDLMDAYRAALLERGYSPTAAEMMTTDYHREFVAQMFQQATAS